jgi:hypothetical protein
MPRAMDAMGERFRETQEINYRNAKTRLPASDCDDLTRIFRQLFHDVGGLGGRNFSHQQRV